MMLKHTIKASIISMLLASNALSADATEHTFADGAIVHYTLPEGTPELTDKPSTFTDVKFLFPFIGETALFGKGELSKDEKGQYTLTLNPKIDPSARIDNAMPIKTWASLKVNDKGSLVIQLSDAGESLKATQFILNQGVSQITGDQFDFTHEFKKVDGSEELYSNKSQVLITNGVSLPLQPEEPKETDIEPLGKNPFSEFKEIAATVSYISGKDYTDYKKDLDAKYYIKGHKNFVLEGTAVAGYPFDNVAGAEKLPGFTMTISVPVIDARVETEEEKKAILLTMKHNVKAYEEILAQYQNPFTDSIVSSVRKNQDELVKRMYQYFTDFSKDDIGSFFLTVKTASQELNSASDRSLAEADIVVRKFNLKVLVDGTENSQKIIVRMEQPETSINELTKYIQSNAKVLEPVLKDLGYWEVVNNFANADKLLSLLRQLSDDPKATGNTPLVITYIINAKEAKVGTLSQDVASQILLGWVLSIVPLK